MSIVFNSQFGPENASNGGDLVAGSPPVEVIFWGSAWNLASTSPSESTLSSDVQALLSSSYLQGPHASYGSAASARLDHVVIDSDSNPNQGFSLGDLAGEVRNAIDHKGLPDPDDTPITPIYVVVTPQGITSYQGSNTSGFHTDHFTGPLWDADRAQIAWLSTPSADGFTATLSHEVAETLTDPSGDGGVTVNPNPAFIKAFPQATGNEIGDYEPGSLNNGYVYRLNGVSVQALWEQNLFGPGNGAYAVTDGNSQVFILTPQYNGNNFLGTYTLTVYGDQVAANQNDTITLDVDLGRVTVTLNGEVATFDPGVIKGITLLPGGGTNTVNIDGTPAGVPVTINDSLGSVNTINISRLGFLDSIQGSSVTINGSGADTLTIDDQNESSMATYTLAGNSVNRTGAALIAYSGVSAVTINGGYGREVYNVQSPAAPATINTGYGTNQVTVQNTVAPLTINTVNFPANTLGASANTIVGTNTVVAQSTGASLTINAGVLSRNTIQLGNGNLDSLAGPVTVNGRGTPTTLTLFDQFNQAQQSYTINSSTIARATTAGASSHTYSYSGVTSLELHGSGGPNTVIDVEGSGAPTILDVDGGANTVEVTPSAGNLSNLPFDLTVHGHASALTVNDRYDQVAWDYRIDATTVSRSQAGTTVPGTIHYDSISTLELDGGGGSSTSSDTIAVESTGAFTSTTVNAYNGVTPVSVSPTARNLDGINDLIVYGGTLTVDDQNNPDTSANATTYTLSASRLTRTASPSLGAPITTTTIIDYFYLQSLTLNTGNYKNVDNVSALSVPTTIKAGAGGDAITVGPGLDAMGQLVQVAHYRSHYTYSATGQLTVDAHGGTLTLDDSGTQDSSSPDGSDVSTHSSIGFTINNGAVTRAAQVHREINTTDGAGETKPPPKPSVTTYDYTYNAAINYQNVSNLAVDGSPLNTTFTVTTPVTATPVTVNGGGGANALIGPNATNTWSITGTNAGNLNGGVAFNSVQNLIGGTGMDVFVFSAGMGVTGMINGGGGGDWLDYAAYMTPVTVDLTAGTATGVGGGIINIQDVIGGQGGDTLKGNAQGNVLVGGAGNDTITGGTGPSVLIGGRGAATIHGNSGNDLIIKGYTAFDNNPAALEAIFAEWDSTDSYTQRQQYLSGPSGHLNGNDFLILSGTNKTVFGNASDTVTDVAGTDWILPS